MEKCVNCGKDGSPNMPCRHCKGEPVPRAAQPEGAQQVAGDVSALYIQEVAGSAKFFDPVHQSIYETGLRHGQAMAPTAAPLVQGRSFEIEQTIEGFKYSNHGKILTDYITALEARPSAEAARIAELEGALEKVLIGGNHLACVLMQDADFPRAHVPEEKVAEYFGAGSTMHEVWICWRAIMHARAALTKPAAHGGE